MKNSRLVLSVPVLALLATPALAQFTRIQGASSDSLSHLADRILQQGGQGGTGAGAWLGPTQLELGSAQGALFSDDGSRTYDLDLSLTSYIFLGLGIEYGGMYGLLTPDAHGRPGATGEALIVQGEWMRIDGPTGQFDAVIFEPTGGVPSLRVVGAFSGRIQFDAWIEPDPEHPGPRVPSIGSAFDVGDRARLGMAHDGTSASGATQQAATAAQPRLGLSLANAPAASALNRASASVSVPKVAPTSPASGRDGGMQLALERTGLAGDIRREAVASSNGQFVRRDEGGDTESSGAAIAGASVERAPVHADLRNRAEADVLLTGTDIVIDATRMGQFVLTYRMLP